MIIWRIIASFAFISSFFVIIGFSPITRLCYLIFVYLAGSFIYTFLDFYYLGQTYIIVYVGAIAIQFLFIIMMIPINIEKKKKRKKILYLPFIILFIFDYNYYTYFTYIYPSWFQIFSTFSDLYTFGFSLYFVYPISQLLIAIAQWQTLIGIIAVCR